MRISLSKPTWGALLIIMSLFNGCQKEKTWQFLDLDNEQKLSIQNIRIMQEAQKRADKYVMVNNGKYTLSISSGKDIAISDRLFRLAIVGAIENSNTMISSGEMYIYDRMMIEAGTEPPIITRINKWGVEDQNILEETIERTWGYTSHTVRFNQIGAREYYNNQFAGSPSATFFSGVITVGLGFITTTTVSGILGLWQTTDATLMQSIGSRVLEASGKGSVTVNETTINGNPYGTVGTTIYDCNGSIIGQFNR